MCTALEKATPTQPTGAARSHRVTFGCRSMVEVAVEVDVEVGIEAVATGARGVE
jgi:hypothetical protein